MASPDPFRVKMALKKNVIAPLVAFLKKWPAWNENGVSRADRARNKSGFSRWKTSFGSGLGKGTTSVVPSRPCFKSGFSRWGSLRDSEGAAILEFAVALPILVVFVVGIYDFSGAFNQKQKIAQAAQEGAIVAGAQPMNDLYSTNANPDSLQPVVTAIFNSLAGSGVLTNANNGSCKTPVAAAGAPTTGLSWTYTIGGCNAAYPNDNLIITINRAWVPNPAPSPMSIGTFVTVQYTYYWQFNSVIQLLFSGPSGYAASTLITEGATVQNQT